MADTSLSAAASASAKGHGAAASQAAVGKRGRNKAKTRAPEVAFAVEVTGSKKIHFLRGNFFRKAQEGVLCVCVFLT